MGLPIWRDPDEKPAKKSALKADPTAAARSSIRRRPSVHGSRNRRLTRDPTFIPPRIERSPPPVPAAISVRYSRRNGVPPIQSLLEHADRSLPLPPPPPPVPLSRNYYTLERRERELRDSLQELHAQAANLRRDAQSFVTGSNDQDNDPWTESERRLVLETASAAQSRRPRLQRSRTRSIQPSANRASSESGGAEASRQFSLGSNILVSDGPAEPVVAFLPRTLLPTPPLEHSEVDGDSLFVPEGRSTVSRPLHPLSRSWRADSPVNGLGDRDRSPTPADAWEIMESTITPDTSFPSAESSFATLPATNSFASSNDTTITEPERESASSQRRSRQDHEEDNDNSDSESASSIDIDCTDEEYIAEAEALAREMYYHEMATPEGRARIFSNVPESDRPTTLIDIGFQLIDSALNSEEGRQRVANLGGEDAIHRMVRFRDDAHRQAQSSARSPPYHPLSPPATSQDPPSANPVSPPSRRSAREVSDILIDLEDGDEQQDLDTMRRVARRLATREEVPDDWWASMGLRLNPSIARPRQRRRARSPDGVRRADMHAERAIGRVRGGRVERGDARL